MTDKVQKIREEVERLKSQLLRGGCSSQIAMETMCKEEAYNEVLAILDIMQEEPKQCMYSKDNYTEEDRKVLCEGCEEKCKFNQVKESAILQHKEETCKENGDSLTQEPVNDELEKAAVEAFKQIVDSDKNNFLEIFKAGANWQKKRDYIPLSDDINEVAKQICNKVLNCEIDYMEDDVVLSDEEECVKAGIRWQMQKESIPSKDLLEELINNLSKQFPEVSFAKLSRIAVRVAKWQKQQFEKERLKHCDELTDEQAQIESDFVTQHLKDNNRTPTFIDAIEYGMKMQKEQMVAKAIDGIARPDDDEVWCDLKSFNFEDGDKVKVIVIKED